MKSIGQSCSESRIIKYSLGSTVVKKADYKADAWKVDVGDINTQKNLLYKMRQELSPANLALELP
ncbi:hypothetical protein NXY07_27185 [Phocaeicola dorei]|nr:hypothetical protein [Phocaeicola dorei]